ncbi:MAG: hypothetical protein ABS81_08185 [Pseudonocardia sp. SCN 72-86]|nr:MAG: hypothetical protein ABS81_08185 [Pseudonocardia sp. SCN 72-86]
MARVESVSLIDDLDGGKADEIVRFSLDGRDLEIDLNEKHASELRDALAPFIGAARRASTGSGRPSYARAASTLENRQQNQAIRAWATDNGFGVSARGRIPAEVLQAYADRNNAPAAVEAEAKPKRRSSKKKTDAA